jgi:competence protein ComEA
MPVTERQIDGLMVCVFLIAAVCLLSFFSISTARRDTAPVHGDPRDGAVVVRLLGDASRGGIYYLPENTPLSRLLDLAGVGRRDRFVRSVLARPLSTGQTVALDAGGGLTVGRMSAAERLSLDLPIDLSRATLEEFMLIPGIGESTAARIVRFRETSGPFKSVADLKKIPGFKEKKFQRWERHFYLPS